jgi:DNA-binding response OmpR family regulator
MTFLHESIPVFVVEDNETHSSQIKSALEEEGFVVRISNTGSRVELYSYKARHSAMQIVIVDLDLGLAEEVDPEQGYELVREQIWPYDRTTIFIEKRCFRKTRPSLVFC